MLYSIKVRIITFLVKFTAKIASVLFNVELPPIPSVSAIIEKSGKILVIELTYRNGYALPGGVLKGNEHFTGALKREIAEETGLSVVSLKFFNTYCDTSEYPKVNATYLVKVKGKLKTGSNEGKVLWLDSKQAMKKLTYPDNLAAIKDYIKK